MRIAAPRLWVLAFAMAGLVATPATASAAEPFLDLTYLSIGLDNEVRIRSGKEPAEVTYRPSCGRCTFSAFIRDLSVDAFIPRS